MTQPVVSLPAFITPKRVFLGTLAAALADVFGIFGLILGPPLAAAIQIAGNHLLHWRLERQSRLRALELPALEQRVAAVRAALSSLRDPPAGLVSLVERLELLLGEVQTWSQSPAAAPRRCNTPLRPPAR
jgi:hypothetical protein